MKPHMYIALRLAFLGLLCVLTVQQTVPLRGAVAVPVFKICENPLINPECNRGENEAPGIKLMQPLDDQTKNLPVSEQPLQVFFDYFNMSWPWLIGVASGIAVLQAVWGGVLIMTSMDLDGGKSKIEWALGGMVLIALVGFILRFLNPTFYQ